MESSPNRFMNSTPNGKSSSFPNNGKTIILVSHPNTKLKGNQKSATPHTVPYALIALYLTTCCQKLMVLCWRDSSRWDIVLVLVLVLDPFGNGLHQLYFFDYENEDDDEKQSNRHFRRLPLESLLSNCPEWATFSKSSLGKSLGPHIPIS